MPKITFQQEPVTLKGSAVQVGDVAPSFTVLTKDLQEVRLDAFDEKIKLVSVVPSIDTGVCSMQTKRFNEAVNSFQQTKALTVSMDLPFAQARWQEEHKAHEVTMLSDHREGSFGEAFGVLMEELRLLCRAIFVIDEKNEVTYVEYVKEVTDHPDYDQVLAHLEQLENR